MPDKRTYANRREELIRAVAKRRRKIKTLSIEYKGGKCQICGYAKYQGALDFHHLNAAEKDFGVADKGYARSWEKVKAELGKCIQVCANCHREVEAGITQPPGVIQVANEVNSGESFKWRTIPSRGSITVGQGVETILYGVGRTILYVRSPSHPMRMMI